MYGWKNIVAVLIDYRHLYIIFRACYFFFTPSKVTCTMDYCAHNICLKYLCSFEVLEFSYDLCSPFSYLTFSLIICVCVIIWVVFILLADITMHQRFNNDIPYVFISPSVRLFSTIKCVIIIIIQIIQYNIRCIFCVCMSAKFDCRFTKPTQLLVLDALK